MPRRVLIEMTPLAACEPYSAAAAAPLMISMLSMSSPSMSLLRTGTASPFPTTTPTAPLVLTVVPELVCRTMFSGTPSTTISGLDPRLPGLCTERICTQGSSPLVLPDERVIDSPATLPCRFVVTPVVGTGMFSVLSFCTAKGDLVPDVGSTVAEVVIAASDSAIWLISMS